MMHLLYHDVTNKMADHNYIVLFTIEGIVFGELSQRRGAVQCNGAVWTAGPVQGPVAYCLELRKAEGRLG